MNKERNLEIHRNLIDNLSEEEKDYLSKINKLGNNTSNNINREKDFLQKNLYTIIKEWSKNLRNIMDDISAIKLENKETEYWWRDIVEYMNKIIYIFIKKDRKIYIGLTLIVIAFLVFSIEITS
jgi:hypothetical protein